ncbi:dienelactone hydrolase family protein [Sphingomonas sp. PL-96]|uniref:dienelactone hydrolase family protein n=1 Tax=Sphingomonas sp. PL-96 TaxID=2887201 RepID=UPI001E3873C6|nr:dienelactone hydrolase family protein [Sphingomonas sp. PL-96]MCC2977823.1 dienelactone hydrolase family protein [Sphingomonas sp. PL-96]
MTDLRERAVALYDAFTHEHRDRRAFMREMVALTGSAVAAEALVAAIAASPAAAQQVKADDPRLRTGTAKGVEAGKPASAYFAAPRDAGGRKLGTVLVIHENRGLTEHIRDVARRVALAGFRAVVPDLLAPQGGTPADEDRARDMIAAIDMDLALAQAQAALARAARQRSGSGKVGVVGFCWGGAFVNRLAVAAGPALNAGVAYYGPAPDPSEASRVQAPLLLHYAGRDARVNATGLPWAKALQAAGKQVEAHVYPDVDHAFNNDTSKERYNPTAAKLAWDRTIAFLHARLDA